jgi:hypothetical protein
MAAYAAAGMAMRAASVRRVGDMLLANLLQAASN